MSRGKRTKKDKHQIFRKICEELGIVCKREWLSEGSTVTADGLEAVLKKIVEDRGGES